MRNRLVLQSALRLTAAGNDFIMLYYQILHRKGVERWTNF